MGKRFFIFAFLTTVLLGACRKDVVEDLNPPINGKPNPDDTVVYNPTFFQLPKYPTLPTAYVPDDNPMSEEAVALGKRLFYDKQLSDDNTQACASCHLAENSFSDPRRFSEGITGALGDRNAMAIVNMAFDRFYFWDGRAESLEEQALEPVVNPVEMNTTWPRVLEKLNADTTYRDQFKAAFNVDVIDSTDVAKAIAQFERTMISANSNYDKFRIGQYTLTPLEEEGWKLFLSDSGGDCFHCHQVGIGTFAGFEMINNGLQDPLVDIGAGNVTGNPLDDGKFKAPTLRNIELTAPYMHDGRFKTLEEVIEFYDNGVNVNSPNVSPFMSNLHRPGGSLNLTQHEKDALVAFLKTLTDQEFVSNPDFLP